MALMVSGKRSPFAAEISCSASQNSSSRLTLVFWPRRWIDRLRMLLIDWNPSLTGLNIGRAGRFPTQVRGWGLFVDVEPFDPRLHRPAGQRSGPAAHCILVPRVRPASRERDGAREFFEVGQDVEQENEREHDRDI